MNELLIQALLKCQTKFEEYEQYHRMKGTPDSIQKAEVNKEMSLLIDKAVMGVRHEKLEFQTPCIDYKEFVDNGFKYIIKPSQEWQGSLGGGYVNLGYAYRDGDADVYAYTPETDLLPRIFVGTVVRVVCYITPDRQLKIILGNKYTVGNSAFIDDMIAMGHLMKIKHNKFNPFAYFAEGKSTIIKDPYSKR